MICKCTWERELGKEEVVMCNGMVEEEMEKVVEGSHSGKVEDATLVVEGICSSREDEEWEMVEEDFDSSKEVVEMCVGPALFLLRVVLLLESGGNSRLGLKSSGG